MSFSQVFIERPVLSTVLSLLILLFGLVCLQRLPNRELPDIDPPVVAVTTVFAGAAPEVVETSVTQPLEDSIIGIEGVRHVTSRSREQVSEITVAPVLSPKRAASATASSYVPSTSTTVAPSSRIAATRAVRVLISTGSDVRRAGTNTVQGKCLWRETRATARP